jgi:hypothetical protein
MVGYFEITFFGAFFTTEVNIFEIYEIRHISKPIKSKLWKKFGTLIEWMTQKSMKSMSAGQNILLFFLHLQEHTTSLGDFFFKM